jgi:type I restriction enzyme, S subunit
VNGPKPAALADLGTVITGSTPKAADFDNHSGHVPFVTPVDLGHLDPIMDAERSLSAPTERSVRLVPAGSVLVCCIGATLGKTGIAGKQLSMNQQINSVTFRESLVYPRYGLHVLRFLKPQLRAMAPATTLPIVSKSKFEQIKIPIPPLPEQRRIADVLDRTDALLTRRRTVIELLDSLAQSIFFDMFGDVTSNDRGWDDSRTLGEIAEIVSGLTKGRIAAGPFTRVPYLAVLNVQYKRLDLSVVKEIDATDAEIERYLLKRDDLLLTEGGDPDKLGRGTLWQEELPRCIHQNHIFRVRINEGAGIDPVFLNWLVASERGRRYFLRSAKQTTGIASINATQLRRFPLLVPPLTLQNQFSSYLAKLEEDKSTHQAYLNKLDDLFASLQHRAFNGELSSPEAN